MDILIFSDNPSIAGCFKLKRNGKLVQDVRLLPWSEFRRTVRSTLRPALCYLDTAGLDQVNLREVQRLVSRYEHLVFGLVDSGRKVSDVAEAFHQGAVDYVDKPALQKGINAERLKRIRAYLDCINPRILQHGGDHPVGGATEAYRESGPDWSSVQTGQEYTFCHMYLELDGKELMEKKYGVDNLSTALASFRSYIENFVRPYQGKLWTWFQFGGIVLFPFARSTSQVLTCVFRLILFKHFYDIESSHFPNFLSFRVAIHVGNLVYHEAKTGETVSDTLNSVFHLGQQYAKPGNVYITREVLKFGPAVLRSFFSDAGTFEGRKILRMRLPMHG